MSKSAARSRRSPAPAAPQLQFTQVGPESVFAQAPDLLAALNQLAEVQRLERLDRIIRELGDHRECHGAIELPEEQRGQLRALVRDQPGGGPRSLRETVQRLKRPAPLLSLPEMVELYRLALSRDRTPMLEPLRQSLLQAIVRNVAAATYFKQFDELHDIG